MEKQMQEHRYFVFTLEIMPLGAACVFVSEHYSLDWAIEQVALECCRWKTPRELTGENTLVMPWSTLGVLAIALYDDEKGIAQIVSGKDPKVFEASIGRSGSKEWEWGQLINVQ